MTTCTAAPAKSVCLVAQRSAQTHDKEQKEEREKREITIRDARRADADFLGRVMLQASRSQLDQGVYDIYFPTFSDDERLALLADMAACSPDAGSVCCWDGECTRIAPPRSRPITHRVRACRACHATT
jgi:hypothetical protein